MSYFVAPEKGLAMHSSRVVKQRLPRKTPDVAHGSLHSPFLISRATAQGRGRA